jgi:predicted DNA-binding ribbon-helix-helix protein
MVLTIMKITIGLEDAYYEVLYRLAGQYNMTTQEYIAKLLIKHLAEVKRIKQEIK